MTAKREAELETENRMLREQVDSLKTVIEQISRPGPHPIAYYSYPVNWCAGYPWYNTWYGTVSVGGEGSVVAGETITSFGEFQIQQSGTVDMSTSSPVTSL